MCKLGFVLLSKLYLENGNLLRAHLHLVGISQSHSEGGCTTCYVAELGEQHLPLAKMVPRVSHVGDALLKPDGCIRQPVLETIASLPEVKDLAANVYSFGP